MTFSYQKDVGSRVDIRVRLKHSPPTAEENYGTMFYQLIDVTSTQLKNDSGARRQLG